MDIAEKIFGPDLGNLKGKTTHQKPMPMVTDQIAIPDQLYENRRSLEMCLDVMFVNKVPCLMTITRNLFCQTATFLQTRTHQDLCSALNDVLHVHNSNGFELSKIICNPEFEGMMKPVADDLDVIMDYVPTKAHVPEAEQNNQTIKERVRAAHHHLPCKALPKASCRHWSPKAPENSITSQIRIVNKTLSNVCY